MQTPYKPIKCDFHELLLAKATLKEVCLIKFYMNDLEFTRDTIIIDVYTKKGGEFMVLKSGETIRLDHIISLNNEKLPKISCTF